MRALTHEHAALALLITFFVLIVVVRALVQLVRTRDHGLRAPRATEPRVKRAADAFWLVVTATFSSAVVLAFAGVLTPVLAPPAVAVGAGVALLGTACAFASQLAMGSSWRIGQRGEATPLVTSGPFAIVRNPIYTSVLVFLTGLALLVPNALMLVAYVGAIVGVQMQVRLVEEPHLRAVHGDAYAAYAHRVGRLVPYLGRQRSRDRPPREQAPAPH